MNVVSRLTLLSLFAVGMAGAEAAAEGAHEPWWTRCGRPGHGAKP